MSAEIRSRSCSVTVSLRNKGEDAFKSDVYGKRIIIIREAREGSGAGGGYKIQDENKKTITIARSELTAICDHFNIQMDNPINASPRCGALRECFLMCRARS